MKRIQVKKYHKEQDPVEKAKIEVDPLKIFHAAVENCKPLLQLTAVKRGGATYQVSVTDIQYASQYRGTWIIPSSRGRLKNLNHPKI
jgi:small subunit ribosomal protein S7